MPKRNNSRILYSVDLISKAVCDKKKVSFPYYSLDEHKQKVYRKEGKRYIVNLLVSELLDELSVAKACSEFKKAVKKYQQVNFLILDERLSVSFPRRSLQPSWNY